MIRKRNPSLDDHAIFELIRKELVPLNAPELQAGDNSDRKLLQRLNRGTTYVWSHGMKPATAFIMMFPISRTMFVDLLAVDPVHRGSGIGTALLKQAELHGWALGCNRLQLYVNDTNEAGIRFYVKSGMSATRHDHILQSFLMEKPIV